MLTALCWIHSTSWAPPQPLSPPIKRVLPLQWKCKGEKPCSATALALKRLWDQSSISSYALHILHFQPAVGERWTETSQAWSSEFPSAMEDARSAVHSTQQGSSALSMHAQSSYFHPRSLINRMIPEQGHDFVYRKSGVTEIKVLFIWCTTAAHRDLSPLPPCSWLTALTWMASRFPLCTL